MGQYGRRRPSAAIVISIVALVIAASGTALAAGRLVSGDSLIKRHSLSGNRLRNDTITGQQIRLDTLGQVPKAKTAANAESLGGHPASAFALGSSGDVRSGLVTASGGQTAKLASFGPFTVSLQCNDDGSGTFDAAIMVTSSAANTEASGNALTAGTAQQIGDAGPDSVFTDSGSGGTGGGTPVDFVAPPDAYMGYLVDAIFMPGTTTPCAASILVGKS
jgi:hypothetical protein